ncbi:MAG: methyl-viologen-reducing hydrogenase subunit delta [Anaerolinea sp.]|nr:methyl-viologen-reducing hydrogenase subunit delta [Anaerolinea sp.]
MNDQVLVIGGGIAGIQTALDLADAGARVVLVERSSAIGGKMAALDKNFPTLDCSICIEAPKLSEVEQHPNIELLSNATVSKVEGSAGNFTVHIDQRARFVSSECTRCGECVPACPVLLKNEFDVGMASRKAIYTPFPQAVPGAYVIDIENCLNEPPNYLPCNRCLEACPPKCIDYTLPLNQTIQRNAVSIVVTTGFELIDPHLVAEYGYGRHPDVLTSMEFERLLTAVGPTGGEIIRPSNGRHPHNILFVLCVGSRDERFQRYCSRFCCMYSIKHAYQAIDHGVKDVTVLSMDLRAYGKGFDGFLERTRGEGAKFFRGRPAGVTATESGLRVRYEDTVASEVREEDFDMVVLATAVKPPEGLADLAGALGVEVDEDGFIRAAEGHGGLIHTSRPGIYAAGCATGPKDIPDSVSEAGAAAASALTFVRQRDWPKEEMAEAMPTDGQVRTGVFVCHCGSNIAGVVDVPRVVDFARTLPTVVHAQSQMFSCAGNTQAEIGRVIREKGINRVVVAACSPKTHEPTFKRVMLRAGLNPYLLEMVNLRNQDSWVHKHDRLAATEKAVDMVRMGVSKAELLVPLVEGVQPVIQTALVVGGGIAGMVAATNLAEQGYTTHLVDKSAQAGGLLRQLGQLAPSGIEAHSLLSTVASEMLQAGVKVHRGVEVEQIGGHVGEFYARLSDGQEIQAGAVILAMGAKPYRPSEFGYGTDKAVITNLELEGKGDVGEHVTFVGCVGSRIGGRGCSRYCCESMIHQARNLRRDGKRVRVLYRDIRTFSRHAEEAYEDALREGVQFFRYDPAAEADEAITFENGLVTVDDTLTGQRLAIPTDTLVLTVGFEPAEESISGQLKVSHSEDGFLLERHPKLGPAEAGSAGIYLAGTAQYPKDVRESVAQALAASSKAGILLSRDTIEKEPITARVDLNKCTVCGRCVPVCPFDAIEMIGPVKTGTINFIEAACEGCGTCSAECNFDAIEMPYFTKEQIFAQIDAALLGKPEEKVLVFACNWCSYAGADQAGIEKVQYPPSGRVIRSMCSGRVEEGFITRAFDRGAGAVLVTGCRLGDCHYIDANEQTLKRFNFWQRKLARKGIAEERLQLQWVSASEGKLFAAKMREMDEVVRRHAASLAPQEVHA